MELIAKVLGVSAILATGLLVGRYIVKIMGQRRKILTETAEVLNGIKSHFFYRKSSVLSAFEQVHSISFECFDLPLDRLNTTRYKEELSARLESSANITKLMTVRQRSMLSEALMLIGIGSLEEECERLAYYIEYFTAEAESATEYERRNKKVVLALCVYASVIVSVILV